MPEVLIDFSDAKRKAVLLSRMSALRGPHRVSVVKHRPRRSDRQNRYYWPCFCEPFGIWLTETQGTTHTAEAAHEILKQQFLAQPVADPKTGEQIGAPTRSTTKLTTVEFNEYLDHCAEFLARVCNIVVPEPDIYREAL